MDLMGFRGIKMIKLRVSPFLMMDVVQVAYKKLVVMGKFKKILAKSATTVARVTIFQKNAILHPGLHVQLFHIANLAVMFHVRINTTAPSVIGAFLQISLLTAFRNRRMVVHRFAKRKI